MIHMLENGNMVSNWCDVETALEWGTFALSGCIDSQEKRKWIVCHTQLKHNCLVIFLEGGNREHSAYFLLCSLTTPWTINMSEWVMKIDKVYHGSIVLEKPVTDQMKLSMVPDSVCRPLSSPFQLLHDRYLLFLLVMALNVANGPFCSTCPFLTVIILTSLWLNSGVDNMSYRKFGEIEGSEEKCFCPPTERHAYPENI